MQVLITGTSSGIGYGLAHEFLARKAKVWGISRREPPGLTEDDLYRHLRLDLTDYEDVRRRLPKFVGGQECFDLVILNSGVLGQIGWMSEVGVEEMKRVVEINVWANKVLLDLLLREVPKVTQVVGMSTKASLRSSPGWGPYSVSKAGLNMLMNVYAKEQPHTHFSSFAPGLVDSEIQETIWNIQETEKYPTVETLQQARHTDAMPDPVKAAPMLIQGMAKALDFESGSYVDVREM
jgi:NAD(P)-dependent dehydrogenase (short-subunit alcohol dehydrogenase family)